MIKRNKLKLLIFFLTLILVSSFFLFRHKKKFLSPNKSIKSDNHTKIISMLSDSAVKIPFKMPDIPKISFPEKICDISNYGAVHNDKAMNTKAFSNAILDCKKSGGGKIKVPPGTWLTGPIHLESNINLNLEKGAVIKFSTNPKDYLPIIFTRYEGIEYYGYSPLIYAENAQNIAITGEGKIDGQGKAWKSWNDFQKNSTNSSGFSLKRVSLNSLYSMASNGIQPKKRVFNDNQNFIQPSFIQFTNCNNIMINGIMIMDSPSWTIHPIYSQNITIKDIAIKTSERNTDGIVIDSSKNILIYNSSFDTGDDAISIKSGKDADGRRVGKPSENIVIHDLKIKDGHSGIAIGSEMSGGIKNLLAYNLDIKYADNPISFKSMVGRGGVVENIWIENVNIWRATKSAILIDLQYGTPVVGYNKNKLPVFRNINLKNIYCRKARKAAIFNGLSKSPLKNITLKNIEIHATRGITEKNVASKNFENVKIETN